MNSQPDVSYLRKLFRYEPNTGVLTWRHRPVDHFATAGAWKIWNTRYSGHEAGGLNPLGYRVVRIDGRRFLAHRVAFAIHQGAWPHQHIDHIDGDTANNRIENLRDVDQQTNMRNSRMSRNNTSGVRGVYWHKGRQKWRAHIKVDRKQKHLGMFDNVEAAAAARKAADAKYGFTTRHGEST